MDAITTAWIAYWLAVTGLLAVCVWLGWQVVREARADRRRLDHPYITRQED